MFEFAWKMSSSDWRSSPGTPPPWLRPRSTGMSIYHLITLISASALTSLEAWLTQKLKPWKVITLAYAARFSTVPVWQINVFITLKLSCDGERRVGSCEVVNDRPGCADKMLIRWSSFAERYSCPLDGFGQIRFSSNSTGTSFPVTSP